MKRGLLLFVVKKATNNLLIIFPFLVSTLMCIAWILKWDHIIQIRSSWVAMQFNTGLAVVLLCISLFLSRNRRFIYSSLFVIFPFLLGFLTFLEYISGLDLKIDTIFIEPHITSHLQFPGRPAIHTSICIIISSISIWCLNRHTTKSNLYAAIISLCPLTLGGLALFGYLLNFPNLYKIGDSTPMALRTAICLVFISLSIIQSVELSKKLTIIDPEELRKLRELTDRLKDG